MARIVTLKPNNHGRRYEVQWSWYVDKDTRKFKRERFRTLEQAKAKKREVEDALSAGMIPDFDAPKRLVAEYAEEWLALKASSLKPSTLRSFRLIYQSSISPAFGHLPVRRVNATAVERFIADLMAPSPSGRTRSPKTVKHHVYVLRKILDRAVRDGGLRINPVTQIENMPTARSTGRLPFTPRFLSAEQVESIARHLDEQTPDAPWGLIVRFAAWTGLRAGEIAGLNVGDLNLLRKIVTVRRTRQRRTVSGEVGTQRGEREWLVHTPKSGKERRVPLIPGWLVADLEQYLAQHPHAADKDAPLFPGTRPGGGEPDPVTGRFVASRSGSVDWSSPWESGTFYRRRFRPAVVALGLDSDEGVVRFHDLRHTFASLAAERGVPSAQVAVWMGHANDTITREVYTHLFDKDSDRYAAMMGAGERPVAETPIGTLAF